jgi:starch-binding outer membrane protein, SusD/RagB family
MRIWGPMPYLRQVLGPGDQFDIPRLSKYETLKEIAMDMDSAAMYFEKAGRMRRDGGPGEGWPP